MKNKQLIYVLIPLALLIWGLIIFKIIKHFRPSHYPVYEVPSYLNRINQEPVNDSLSLILNYRDPFLKGLAREFSSSGVSTTQQGNNGKLSTGAKQPVSFPDTKYSGLIVSSKNKNKLGIIQVGNKNYLVREGEIVAGEKIVALYTDSVKILFNNSGKTFFITR